MPRPSRENELLNILKNTPEGATFKELLQFFPRKTLDRLLKETVRKRVVIKTPEYIEAKRGRPGSRYKLSSITPIDGEWDIGCGLTTQTYSYKIQIPCKQEGGMIYFGKTVRRYGRVFVRLSPSQKARIKRSKIMQMIREERIKRLKKLQKEQ